MVRTRLALGPIKYDRSDDLYWDTGCISRSTAEPPVTSDHRYEIDIYWSESDQAFVAEVPELPGCVADGATYVEALSEAQEAIAVWIHAARELGRNIPVPRQRQTQT